MAKKLDAARIEQARQLQQKKDIREIERERIRNTISQNRNGERRGRVIMPEKNTSHTKKLPKLVLLHIVVLVQLKKHSWVVLRCKFNTLNL